MGVAPYVGAWIEIDEGYTGILQRWVAPYVGAWIEIRLYPCWLHRVKVSHPTWVRGLKLNVTDMLLTAIGRTLRGCVD